MTMFAVAFDELASIPKAVNAVVSVHWFSHDLAGSPVLIPARLKPLRCLKYERPDAVGLRPFTIRVSRRVRENFQLQVPVVAAVDHTGNVWVQTRILSGIRRAA